MVHGEDFVADLVHTKKTLETKYKLKTETLGTGEGCKQEIRLLNTVLRRTAKGPRSRRTCSHTGA